MKCSRAQKQIGPVLCLLALILTIGSSAAVAYAATAAPANGGLISGEVSSPGGYPLPAGTLVKLFDADVETVHGQAIPDPNDGAFQIGPVRNGLYVLKAVPPEASGYTQSLPRAVSVVNAPVSVGTLALTEPQVFGTVLAPDGLTQVDAEVLIYLGDGQILQKVTADGGDFLIGGLPVGGYGLRAFPLGDQPYWKSAFTGIRLVSPGLTQTVTLSLEDADLWGYFQDDQGNPITEAMVTATNESGGRASDRSNAHGFWAIGGLAAGTYQLNAQPPWPNSGLLPPETVAVTLPGATNPYTLIFSSPPKLVQGTVSTNTGGPVLNAQVTARRVNMPGQVQTLSTADGSYQLSLAPGLWALTVNLLPETVPDDWVYPKPPQLVYFHHNDQSEDQGQDFTVQTADAEVSGVVQMPDTSPPPFTVTIGLHNDEGVGLRVQVDLADGSFERALPNGAYKVAVHPHDPGYVGPGVDPIIVPPDGVYDLGTLTLLPRDAVISGTVTTDGVAVSGIPLVAWRPGVPGSLRTTSGPDGLYALAVSAGIWHIQPAPGPDQPYLYTGAGEQVELEAGGLAPGVDFSLIATDATISGSLVDEAGHLLSDAYGWATASQLDQASVHNGAPIEGGLFTIHIPGGAYRVAAHLPAGGSYTSAAKRLVTVEPGGNTDVTLTLEIKDARISGALWDPRNQDVVDGVNGLVGAWSGSNWAATPINAGNGTYRMGVSAGLWHLNYRIDPEAGYAKVAGPFNVPVQAEQTAILPLPILPKDAQIGGTVLAPDGSPLPGVTVLVKGVSPLTNGLWLQTHSDQNGNFNLIVPYGRYHLGAAGGDPVWIKPAERTVNVLPGGISGEHVLQFREPDTTISGKLTVSNTMAAGEVQAWAWSEDGGFVRGRFLVALGGTDASGSYQFGVTSGTTWHLGAVFETESQYWFGHVEVPVAGGDVTYDITLEGPHPKPAPVAVTFDASEPQHISLADGTHIFIPAGAMPVSGIVTLRVVPIAGLPHQRHANVFKYGYAFLATDANGEPIEAHFNQDVVITFAYDEAELTNAHIHESWLKPAYYSTTVERWTFPESYVVDTQANWVVMQIDHFTDYALTGVVGFNLYLPVTVQ